MAVADEAKSSSSLLKQYLAPAGVGILVGAVSTLGTTIPKLLDAKGDLAEQSKQITEQATQIQEQAQFLGLIEDDTRAYSEVLNALRAVLDNDDYYGLFPQDADILYEHEENLGTDAYYGYQLKRTRSGAYFLWEDGGYDSPTGSASYGTWFTREEAISWAYQNVSSEKFDALFTQEEQRLFLDTDGA